MAAEVVTGTLALRKFAKAASTKAWLAQTGQERAADIAVGGVDRLRATNAGRALSRAWRAEVEDGATYRGALDEIDSNIDRTATTETVQAWNESTLAQNDAAAARGHTITERWDALLDKRTCPECDSLAGTEVTRPEEFDREPPIHPGCRCFIVTEVD